MFDSNSPTHFKPGEGTTYKVGRMRMTFKTTSDERWNAYTVCEAIEPSESGAGYHRHPTYDIRHTTYDETFIICEGQRLSARRRTSTAKPR